ncbi:MAG: hypothetical protein JNK61_10850 [Bacteroidia bacterium]|nr:hypothetical protein [Bacteroidia bacterium]
MKSNILKTFAVLLVSILSMHLGACKKTSNADARVTVVDSLNRPIKGAKVVLRQDSVVNPNTGIKADILDEKITDINGNTNHSFKWEAVLNLEVSKGNLKVQDYIRLEQSETVGKTVVLK